MESISTFNSEASTWRKGMVDGLPIAIGYMPVAITFGLLASTTGLTVLDSLFMSMIVFAGASQYMALTMIALGSGAIEIIMATFIVNFRHLLMSASINEKAEKSPKLLRAIYAFGLTDEVFAVASTKETPVKSNYILCIAFMAYSSWVSFTVVGYYAGEILPSTLQESMAIALYALFIALLVPSIKTGGKTVIMLAILGALFHGIFQFWLSTGWAIMFGTIVAVVVFELIEMSVKKEVVKE
ncbi:AzlC family ABC transporter permease [Evansella cellulosilytica]|uniref:AzlC family protein n=1 Tax=Evansella cellulosilytica (strain ATCC 21833 / DSM 2522 / FERM P-1141 / JCM 9156 / N-4) TaxID=649639 RepID=E6TXY8_EVAC2|nr:AzlC family ABC transporter permease [Evansella cellulosilytica]ADU31201.1 AzlC family protein [Evansella cellulosilytica DSM 2522]